MAEFTEEPRPDDEEEEGGPVKTFLEHLEDLRWMLIKSGTALLVALIVCLYGAPWIVWVLKRPLQHAALLRTTHSQKVAVRLGTNTIATFDTVTNHVAGLDLGTNAVVFLQLEAIGEGTNQLLSLRADPHPPQEAILAGATDLVYLDPSQPFLSVLHLALWAGIVLAAPFIFYFVAQFVLPALKVREKKYVLRACAVGVGLFVAGVCLCYFFVLARALKFAELFALWMGVKVPEWRAETYFSFVTKFMLGMGLGFELPVVLLALVKIGLLDYAKLSALRRYMIVINLVIGALLTTPEVFTQVVMAIVLQFLYEVTVWIAWYWERRDRRREAAEQAAGGGD